MRIGCFRMTPFLKHGERGLTEAERLALEQHLDACASCRREALAVDAMGDLIERASPPPNTAAAHDQIVTRALREATDQAAPSARSRGVAGRAALALGVAGLALALWGARAARQTSPASTSTTVGAEARPASADRVASGAARGDGRVLGPGDSVPASSMLALREETTLAVGDARVTAEVVSALSWEPARSLVTLREGRLSVDVDPRAGRRFRVVTRRFSVEVLGTRFVVDQDHVTVERGVVRVLERDGDELLAELRAGQSWSPAAPPLARPAREERPRASASESLARARAHLAKGAIASAERDVAAALASQPTRSQAAEAWTLRAECALVSGDPEGAAKLYRDVSGRYADLPAGETALFAAARIQANAGRPATAEALLRSYLARYPRGRFQSEATARLRALHEE